MNIKKFITWVNEGRRAIRIDYDTQTPDSPTGPHIWCYDYNLMAGAKVGIDDEPPTPGQLKNERRADLEEQLAALEEK